MNKVNDILNEIHLEDFFDSSGYLKTHKNLPVYSLGDILEKTGQILFGLSTLDQNDPTVSMTKNMIITGLHQNEIVSGLIPRTIFDGIEEPQERKAGLWEYYGAKWRRTDISHSQFFYLCFGLYYSGDHELLKKCLHRVIEGGWKTRNLNGKIVPYGKFKPYGNSGLRLLALLELCNEFEIDGCSSLYQELMAFLNVSIMSIIKIKTKPSDMYNTAFCFKILCDLNHEHIGHFKSWKSGFKQYPVLDMIIGNESRMTEYEEVLKSIPINADESYFKLNHTEKLEPGEGNVIRSDYLMIYGLYQQIANKYKGF